MGKENITPDDIVKVLDVCHKFVEKHGANKEKFVQEVMRAPFPNRLNQPKIDKTTLNRRIKKSLSIVRQKI